MGDAFFLFYKKRLGKVGYEKSAKALGFVRPVCRGLCRGARLAQFGSHRQGKRP